MIMLFTALHESGIGTKRHSTTVSGCPILGLKPTSVGANRDVAF